MTIQKIYGWEKRLSNYLLENMNSQFCYGKFDCCLFTAGAVEVMTGVNVMSEVEYKNKAEALHLVNNGTVAKILSEHFVRRPVLETVYGGDIVVVNANGIDAYGICISNTKYVSTGLNGLVTGLMTNIIDAWGLN